MVMCTDRWTGPTKTGSLTMGSWQTESWRLHVGEWVGRTEPLVQQKHYFSPPRIETRFGGHLHLPKMGWWVLLPQADDTSSGAEVLSRLVCILFTQTQQRVSLAALKYPVSHGPTENSGHLGGQWAGRLTRPVYLSETWPKVTEENFVCVSSLSSEWPLPSHQKARVSPCRVTEAIFKS